MSEYDTIPAPRGETLQGAFDAVNRINEELLAFRRTYCDEKELDAMDLYADEIRGYAKAKGRS